MNAKQIGWAVGVVLVVGAVAAALSLFGQKEGVAVAPVADTSPVLGGVATSTTAYEYVDNAPYYSIDIVYPRKTLLTDPAADLKARTTIEQAIAAGIAQFKKDGDFANLTPEDIQIQGLGPDKKYALAYSYTEYQGTNTVSEVFSIYEDTLGAHPNGFYQTFTFDKQGNELALGDLFLPAPANAPGSAYLNTLSQASYQAVVAELGQREGTVPDTQELETARMGTEPSPEALQFFYLDGHTLHLLFPPYQVAAYALGSFDIAIPPLYLANLKPEYK